MVEKNKFVAVRKNIFIQIQLKEDAKNVPVIAKYAQIISNAYNAKMKIWYQIIFMVSVNVYQDTNMKIQPILVLIMIYQLKIHNKLHPNLHHSCSNLKNNIDLLHLFPFKILTIINLHYQKLIFLIPFFAQIPQIAQKATQLTFTI